MADYKRTISPDMHLAYLRQGVGKEMEGYSYTPACCMSKPRSSLEAGKKQPIVWLQHVCGVTELFLYPSFRVGFNPTFLTLGRTNAFVLYSLNRKVPLVLLLSPYGDSEIARNGFEDGSKWCTTINVYGMNKETGFVA